MAGAEKTLKSITGRAEKLIKKPWKALDPKATIKSSIYDAAGDVTSLFTPEIPMPEEETIIPIPDERMASVEARRRRARKVGTGRDSTILTEGLGG